jgi:hypothetical protein
MQTQSSQLKSIFDQLDKFEKKILLQQMQLTEIEENLRFINIAAYLDFLARQIIARQNNGEFVPRSLEEAQAGQ